MMLARMPAKDGAVFGIRDAGDLVGEAKPLGRAHGSGDREIRGRPVRGERNRYGEPGSPPKSLTSGNQLLIAMLATKFSVTLVLLMEPVVGKRLPPA